MIPFSLPKEPVDGYKITLYEIHDFDWTVREWTAVYHVNRTWLQVFPESDIIGAPFEDEWAIYDAGSFRGRYSSWEWKDERWENHFTTRGAAELAMRARIQVLIGRKQHEIRQLMTAMDHAPVDQALQARRTLVDGYIRDLYKDIATMYEDFDIYSGWNLKRDSDAGRAAATALDIVVQELKEKAEGR